MSVGLLPSDMVTAAAELASDVLSEFGLAEPIALRFDGRIAVGELGASGATLAGWATRAGVAG
jgi:hypothetical protein